MTENDPGAPGNSGAEPSPSTGEQAGWSQSAHGEIGQGTPSSAAGPSYPAEQGYQAAQPHQAEPAYPASEQPYAAPNPWSAQAQQQSTPPPGQAGLLYGQPVQAGIHGGQQGPPTGPLGPQTNVYTVPPEPRPARNGSAKLVVGVAVLALIVGGAAGGLGGYLAGGSSNGTVINSLDSPASAQQTGNAPAGSVESVAQKLSPSVVELQVSGATESGEGSGFVISTDGYIMTNNHVVAVAAGGGTITAVFPTGQKVPAKVVGRDPTTDIAVVKVDGVSGLKPVELGRSDSLKVGQPVVAIGSPFDLAGTVTSGIVSSLHRPVRAGGGNGDQTTVMDAVQTDAAINPGNSGGPLANMAGQVVGMNSAIYSPQSASSQGGQSQGGNVGIGFSIPIDQASRTANDIIKTGKAIQTYIGAGVSDAPPPGSLGQGGGLGQQQQQSAQPGSDGALLSSITPGSPADKAGLKVNDVVVKLDNLAIPNSDALVAAIRTRAPSEQVKLTLSDNRVVTVTLGGQPVTPN
ncbi:MAG: pepD [Amycolatopsis sp.]|jgi:putative serine protease PepD|uniref:S1C family serine protease n=1 Tax=Amycolatopsis sp. TaxID=37632 RepID=UPI00260899C1|nr:trypsin-like peptidase domain-containing protein [Amycolatopsis sp.]MCU1679918.1 pepD [Amycolatopsis sp.]